MSHLLSNIPLVIDFPPAAELNEAFFTAALQQNESAFAMYQQLADIIAKIIATRTPDADRYPYLAIGESCAMLSYSLKNLESWADQYPEDGKPYWFFYLRKGKAISVIPDVEAKLVTAVCTPHYTPSGQVAKFFDSSEIKETETYRSELKEQIEASTAHLADLLFRYQKSLELAYKNKHLDNNQACNLMLDLDNAVAAALFTNRWTGHLGKIAACLSSRYSDSWGV